MKFKDIETNTIIEVVDELTIERYKGYPDKFEKIAEQKKEIKEEKKK